MSPRSLSLNGLLLTVWFSYSHIALPQQPHSDSDQSRSNLEFFETRIRPILANRCYECHSQDAEKIQGGLLLDRKGHALLGGDSGPVIEPGDLERSLLIQAVRYREESLEMPPKAKLPDSEIALLERWVEMGAPWPEDAPNAQQSLRDGSGIDFESIRKSHWAFRPVSKPKPPKTKFDALAQRPLDQFLFKQLEDNDLEPAPIADPRTRIRRLYLTLTGLPPSQEQVAAFQSGATTWSELVDDALASPHFGERWARHWMDVARYSDGMGGFLDSQALPEAWRFRDWVVDAINQDMPTDEFIQRQIAGDLLPGARDHAPATGFFAVGPTYVSDGGDPEATAQALAETLSDRVDTFSRAFMGLTVACARCHDHKFDPVTMADYYAIAGIFKNSTVGEFPLVDDAVVDAYNQRQTEIRDTDGKIKTLNQTAKQEERELTPEETETRDQLQAKLERLKETAPAKYDWAHALRETGSANMPIAIRGDLRKEGDIAIRRFLEIIPGATDRPFTEGSGRRELAEAVVAPTNPLTARVFVNRVWQWTFGAGLVGSTSNFGTFGEEPSHPELLDWLTATFIEDGWSLKKLQRRLLTSSTFQMSSQYRENAFAVDPANRLHWRMSPRRLEVESWRDSLLQVSGLLDTSLGGRPVGEILDSARRSLYATISRNGDRFRSEQFLRDFDFPAARVSSAGRSTSSTPQQYLFMLNSDFMKRCADSLANTIRDDKASQPAPNPIQQAYQRVLQRDPTADELEKSSDYLKAFDDQKTGLARLAQVLLSLEEFRQIQ